MNTVTGGGVAFAVRSTIVPRPTLVTSTSRDSAAIATNVTNFYGNFYIRSTDLLALANCNTESVFGFDLAHDEQNVIASHVTIQAALLYTSVVTTQALLVTSLSSEVVASIDTDACCALLAKHALNAAIMFRLDNGPMRSQQICIEIIRAA